MIASLGYTLDFVRDSLPQGCRRILEIGCGNGALARSLTEARFDVVAVDCDERAIAEAKTVGVDARLLSWPAPIEGRFDAILFTRSLHHADELDAAVDAAMAALDPGGRIIVEDFHAEGGSDRAAAWFERWVAELADRDLLRSDADIASIVRNAAPSDHDHELHSSAAIAAALARSGRVNRADAAYYFRYVELHLKTPEAAEPLLAEELAAIAGGTLDPLGQRFVLDPFFD